MNRSAEELITQEHESMKAMKEVAESRSISAMYRCISDVANDVNCNARWGNAAQVFVTYKATVEDILMKTERGELSTREALQRIADACAEAKNDQRDGLLLIEQLFGIHDGSEGTASRERKLFEACGTTDWMEIHRTLFPGIYAQGDFDVQGMTRIRDDGKLRTPVKNGAEESEKDLAALLEELNALIGLESVKSEVNSFINLVQLCKERERRGIEQPDLTMHLVFTGNPGTGKTTIARLLAKIYKQLGVLSKGHLVEVERADLCGGYVGQTAIKTKEVIDKALGGVLFIDEAYSLANSKSENDYGRESIETLLKAMEDHRDDFIVIAAGYTAPMASFINSNPGLRSRFNKFIEFQDYQPTELFTIFQSICKKAGFQMDRSAEKAVMRFFEMHYSSRGVNYANARDVRNFFEKVMTNQANRLANDRLGYLPTETMMLFTVEDVLSVAKEYGFDVL